MSLRIELITIGNEILDGRRIDTNSAWIGGLLRQNGILFSRRAAVSDDLSEIVQTIREVWQRADFVITTGGLGPTDDDITFEALAKAFNVPLIFQAEVMEQIQKKYADRGLQCPKSNRRQAMLPANAKYFPNAWGTAPALKIQEGSKQIFVLPGVPLEMMNLFQAFVLPEILAAIPQKDRARVFSLRYLSIPEAKTQDILTSLHIEGLSSNRIQTAYTVTFPFLTLSFAIYAGEETFDSVQSKILQSLAKPLGDYFVGEGETPIEEMLVTELMKRGETLSIAESITGGSISAAIVNVPDSSKVFQEGMVTYSNQSKMKVLLVRDETLKNHGAVSEVCAREMAEGILRHSGSDWAIASTGIAGPGGGTPEKPLGLTYLAWANRKSTEVKRYEFRFDRNRNRMLCTQEALLGLYRRVVQQKDKGVQNVT